MLFKTYDRKKDANMKKVRLTESGKIFFGIIIFVIIILLIASYLNNQNQSNQNQTAIPVTYAYCIPDCLPQALPIGYTTLARGCYINKTECQNAAQTASKVALGFRTDSYKVQGIGTVTMLDLNVTKIYVRENNQTEWITLFDGQKTFDLVSIQNQTAIISTTDLQPADYTQEKIVLGNGMIKIYSLAFNLYGNTNYTITPASNETVINYNFNQSTGTTLLTFDLDLQNSIKHTVDGYLLYPQFNVSSSVFQGNQLPDNSILIS